MRFCCVVVLELWEMLRQLAGAGDMTRGRVSALTHLERSERHGSGTVGGSAEPRLQVSAVEGFVDCERERSLASVCGTQLGLACSAAAENQRATCTYSVSTRWIIRFTTRPTSSTSLGSQATGLDESSAVAAGKVVGKMIIALSRGTNVSTYFATST